MLEIKIETKNVFDRLISRTNIAKERTCKLRNRATETYQREMEKNKMNKIKTGHKELWANYKRHKISINGLPEAEKERERRRKNSSNNG